MPKINKAEILNSIQGETELRLYFDNGYRTSTKFSPSDSMNQVASQLHQLAELVLSGTTAKKFKIKYVHPETHEWEEVEEIFSDAGDLLALGWAQDAGYSLADKGQYEIHEWVDNKYWKQVS